MTKILDPVTGEALSIYGQKIGSDEGVYPCNEEMIIATIISRYMCDRVAAIRMLANSDIENTIKIHDEEFWAE